MSDRQEREELEMLFRDIPEAHKVRITRREPDWCEGLVEEKFYDPENPISLADIQKKWGGSEYQIRAVDENGRFRKSKIVQIADVPRFEGKPIDRNFKTTGVISSDAPAAIPPGQPGQPDALGGLAQFQQVMAMAQMMGWKPPNAQENQTSEADLMRQKIMVEMMQSQADHQAEQRRREAEDRREQERWRREQREYEQKQREKQMEQDNTGMNEIDRVFETLGKMEQYKSTFGGESNPLVAEAINQAAPILQSTITEVLNLQKLKIQSELAKVETAQANAPALAPRTTGQAPQQLPSGGNGKTDPVALAADMGRLYKSLPMEQQQAVITAFTSQIQEEPDAYDDESGEEYNDDQTENVHTSEKDGLPVADNDETIHNSVNIPENVDTLDAEDRAVLTYGESHDATDQDVQNGEHAAPVSPND